MQKSTEVYRYEGRPQDARPIFASMLRGAVHKCPACSVGAMFRRYLKVADACPHCGEELHHHRADDAPAYFTIVIVGHIVVGLVLAVEIAYRPALWVHAALWLPLTVILTLGPVAVGEGRARGAAMGAAHARLRSQLHGRDRKLRRQLQSLPSPAPP